MSLGNLQQAHVFSSESGHCEAFLANYNPNDAAKVMFNNMHYTLPPWLFRHEERTSHPPPLKPPSPPFSRRNPRSRGRLPQPSPPPPSGKISNHTTLEQSICRFVPLLFHGTLI
ncbi:hypothetical protein M8C21_024642 [Ambrosia artemisiifolia]|uniref:Beta-galactosidase beta-sandwich domain-containing protein n=1 Tax=Ambrosia artemisiifolia TaxID=4212 RepID=A0AAD5GM63_AMBAR|nr:hypothetical protein M8C21_024642 [Ambrosia artemisiifolia]